LQKYCPLSPPFRKKLLLLFVIGAPFLSTVGTGAFSFPCRKTCDFPSYPKQVFLLFSEQVCLLFLNEIGAPSISCELGVPLRCQNKRPFSSLMEKQFFPPSPRRGLLFAKLIFPTCLSGLHRFPNSHYVCSSPYSVTRFNPP